MKNGKKLYYPKGLGDASRHLGVPKESAVPPIHTNSTLSIENSIFLIKSTVGNISLCE
jgi:hypothetical protein